MTRIRAFLQHHLNAMHIYCRLNSIVGRERARRWACAWEGCLAYRLIY